MKKINFYGLILFSSILVIISGCTTEETFTTTPKPTNNTEIPPNNTVISPNNTVIQPKPELLFNTYAGEDHLVILPTDYIRLEGTFYSFYSLVWNINEIDSFVWKKISGPSTYILESPNSRNTMVSKMGKGIYEFELTITDKSGLIDKDTTTVTVDEMSSIPNEIIFKDRAWICPMGCHVEIKNINSYFPNSSVFQIFIQRDNSANWEELGPTSSNLPASVRYTYEFYNGSLIILSYSSDEETDTPNIKIVSK